jgi:transposase
MSLELGLRQWKLALGTEGGRTGCRFTVEACDLVAVVQCVVKAKVRLHLPADARVHSCYEAGRDGWWLHRRLREQGIDNVVVDSSSIEVNRRRRRSKSDMLDADKLLAMLQRHFGGEHRVWSVVHEPSVQQEDERRVHRELLTLGHECTRHTNRIGSLLALHGVRAPRIAGRSWPRWWDEHSKLLPPALVAQIERECERLLLARRQIAALERQRRQQQASQTTRNPMVAQFMRLRGLALPASWMLTYELFGWRTFANRRQLASCLGITPTPYASGELQREQGISKAGNKRLRALLVQLSWLWLRLQPDSELTRWFQDRFASGGKRMRRIGIVALARRLAVALWRYVTFGQIPPGATLKPAP